MYATTYILEGRTGCFHGVSDGPAQGVLADDDVPAVAVELHLWCIRRGCLLAATRLVVVRVFHENQALNGHKDLQRRERQVARNQDHVISRSASNGGHSSPRNHTCSKLDLDADHFSQECVPDHVPSRLKHTFPVSYRFGLKRAVPPPVVRSSTCGGSLG